MQTMTNISHTGSSKSAKTDIIFTK